MAPAPGNNAQQVLPSTGGPRYSSLGEQMNDDTDKRRFHPSEWGGKEKELVRLPEGLHDEHRAWLAWFGDILCRVGFTSFGQACKEALPKTDETGSRPQLQMSQRTLTNWIKAEKLPHDKTFLDTMQYLNERIKERRRSHPDAPDEVTDSEVAEGLRLLKAARRARDARRHPAQHAADEVQRELSKVFDELDKMRAAQHRLRGQVETGRTFIALMQRTRLAVAASNALQDDFDQAVHHVGQLEEQLEKVEAALEHWQSRYDRLHAEYEMAREAAQEERLAMQDELSELRAALWCAQQNLQEATASRSRTDVLADRLEEELQEPSVEQTVRQLIDLRDKREERDQLLRTVCRTWSDDSIYLLAMRLGDEPGVGPLLARELMSQAGVHYYDPRRGQPGVFLQWWCKVLRTRLEPRSPLPRTDVPFDDGYNIFAFGDGTQV